MKRMPKSPMSRRSEARRRVEAYCQSLVDVGAARWSLNDDGETELHLASGEAYLFLDQGLMRLSKWKNETEPYVGFID